MSRIYQFNRFNEPDNRLKPASISRFRPMSFSSLFGPISNSATVGRNQGGVQNSTIQNALDNAPSNCFAGQCAEINALSRALNKGRSLDGATISVSNVRGPASTTGIHGTPKTPCTACDSVLEQTGVKYTQ